LTKNSRRIRPIVSTVNISPSAHLVVDMGNLKQRHGRGLTLEADYPSQGVNVARRITIRVVLDNLSTHSAGALYEAFPACEAHPILRCLEFHFVPKHASYRLSFA
jgi:hypothetical protein